MRTLLCSDASGTKVNGLLKNIICGMSTILVIAPVKRAEELNIDDYMHSSATEAVHSDWMRVGQDLTESASEIKDHSKRVE